MFRLLTFILIIAVTSYHAYHATAETRPLDFTEMDSNFQKDAPTEHKIEEELTPIKFGNEIFYKSWQVDELLHELKAEIKKQKDFILFLKERNVKLPSTDSKNGTEPCDKSNRTFTFKSGLTDVSKLNLQLHKKVLHLSEVNNVLKRDNENLNHSLHTLQLDCNKQRDNLEASNKKLSDDILSQTKIITEKLQQESQSKAETQRNILNKVAVVDAEVKSITEKLQQESQSKAETQQNILNKVAVVDAEVKIITEKLQQESQSKAETQRNILNKVAVVDAEVKIITEKLQQESQSKAETQQNILNKVAVVDAEVKEMTKKQTAEFSKLQNSTKHMQFDLQFLKCPILKSKAAAAGLTLTKIAGRDYIIDKENRKTWSDARQFCKSLGMGLLSVETEQEHQALSKYLTDSLGGYRYWTSGQDEAEEGSWMWTETAAKFTLTSHSAIGGSRSKNCMRTYLRGSQLKYNDYPFSSNWNVICESQVTCV